MVFTVEVRLIGGDLITSMTHMRTWLDHQRVKPDTFRHSSGGAGITFRVDFKCESDAVSFTRAFGGRLIGLPIAMQREAPLWPSRLPQDQAEFTATGLEPVALASARRR
jgi:hypothetical protein